MAAYNYNYKYIIKVAPIANITISETGETTAIEPISTFMNVDTVTEEVGNWIENTLPELMTNNSYVDPFMEDLHTLYHWAFYERGITNFPYIKEIASSEDSLRNLEWSAELPEGKVYFAYVEEQEWWKGELQSFYMGIPFLFRLPFLSGDDQLGTNLLGDDNYSGDNIPQ